MVSQAKNTTSLQEQKAQIAALLEQLRNNSTTLDTWFLNSLLLMSGAPFLVSSAITNTENPLNDALLALARWHGSNHANQAGLEVARQQFFTRIMSNPAINSTEKHRLNQLLSLMFLEKVPLSLEEYFPPLLGDGGFAQFFNLVRSYREAGVMHMQLFYVVLQRLASGAIVGGINSMVIQPALLRRYYPYGIASRFLGVIDEPQVKDSAEAEKVINALVHCNDQLVRIINGISWVARVLVLFMTFYAWSNTVGMANFICAAPGLMLLNFALTRVISDSHAVILRIFGNSEEKNLVAKQRFLQEIFSETTFFETTNQWNSLFSLPNKNKPYFRMDLIGLFKQLKAPYKNIKQDLFASELRFIFLKKGFRLLDGSRGFLALSTQVNLTANDKKALADQVKEVLERLKNLSEFKQNYNKKIIALFDALKLVCKKELYRDQQELISLRYVLQLKSEPVFDEKLISTLKEIFSEECVILSESGKCVYLNVLAMVNFGNLKTLREKLDCLKQDINVEEKQHSVQALISEPTTSEQKRVLAESTKTTKRKNQPTEKVRAAQQKIPLVTRPLEINWGREFFYDSTKGTNQKVVALNSPYWPAMTHFGVFCVPDKAFPNQAEKEKHRAALWNGTIVSTATPIRNPDGIWHHSGLKTHPGKRDSRVYEGGVLKTVVEGQERTLHIFNTYEQHTHKG